MKEDVEKLIPLLTTEEQAKMKILYNATISSANAYRAESTERNLANWQAAEGACRDELDRLHTHYSEKSDPVGSWKGFANSKSKADILRQLQDLGYEITERTFYRHCAQGKCRTGKGGLFTRRLVKQYVEAEGLIRHGEDPDDIEGPSSALSVEKQRLENDKLRIHNQTAELELRKKSGLLIEREALYLELAARVVVMDNGFRQSIEMEAPALIAAIGGEVARQPEFIDLMLGIWNELLNGFATTEEFEVLFEAENDNQPRESTS